MKFSHYSAAPIRRVRSVPQTDAPDMKPKGLWLSVDGPDDWPTWCTSEKFKVFDEQRLRYRVTLHMARILVLSTEQELDDFTTGFVVVAPWEKSITDTCPHLSIKLWINWKRVAELYAGIIIAPYLWGCRMDFMWYYGWDCASGCVWDAAAVLSINRLASVRPRRIKATSRAKPATP